MELNQEGRELFDTILDAELGAKASPGAASHAPSHTPDQMREWGGKPLRVVEGGAVSLPVDVGVTRQGQNPDSDSHPEGSEAFDDELDAILAADLHLTRGLSRRVEGCSCGASRNKLDPFCEVCQPSLLTDPTAFDRAVARWDRMGAPDQDTYARRFGCPCLCHRGGELIRRVSPTPAARAGLEAPLAWGTFALLAFAAVGLARAVRRVECLCPGEVAPFDHERRRLGLPASPEARRDDPLECAQWRARRALSGLSAGRLPEWVKPESDRAALLPPMGPIAVPEGPAAPAGQLVTWCSCECHGDREPCACPCHVPECCMTDDGRAPHQERGLAFAGCRCKAHDAVACGWNRSGVKQKPCACAKAGPGERRPKQKPFTAERKARRECAKLTPPLPSIPDPCSCACHVPGCCTVTAHVAGRGERREHSGVTMFGSCPCREHEASTCSLKRLGPRILATKIDTLHLSWHVTLSRELLDTLEKKLEQAKKGFSEFVTVKLKGKDGTEVLWRVHPSGGGRLYRYRLSNERADLLISRMRAENAAPVRFELRAAFMWEAELEGAWLWSTNLANGIHVGPKCPRSVLTRLDMCVDVTGVDFARAIRDEFVTRARKRSRHSGRASEGDACPRCTGTGVCGGCAGTGVLSGPLDDLLQLDEHASGRHVSGFSFGHGGIVARIYDKTREIREKSKDKKWLYLCWAEKGWVGAETVWRVEVQIRRETLTELVGRTEEADKAIPLARKLRGTALAAGEGLDGVGDLMSPRSRAKLGLDTLEGCRAAIASMWAYAVGGRTGHTAWLKWTVPDPDDGRRSRWDAKPEWKVIQGACWGRAEPFALCRLVVRDARFDTLLPQWVGLTRAMSALAGSVQVLAGTSIDKRGREVETLGHREPLPGDFLPHLEGYVTRRRADELGTSAQRLWMEWVQEARVERRLVEAACATEEDRVRAIEAERARIKERRAKSVAAMAL